MQVPGEDGVYLVRLLSSLTVYQDPHLSLQLYRDTVKVSLAALQPPMFISAGNSRQWSSPSVLPHPSRRVRAL